MMTSPIEDGREIRRIVDNLSADTDVTWFLDALREWLVAKHDPRVRVWREGGIERCTIVDLAACAADFCLAKAEQLDAEAEAKERARS